MENKLKEFEEKFSYAFIGDFANAEIQEIKDWIAENFTAKASRLKPLVMEKIADFTSAELLIKMNEIIEEYPHQGNFAEDGRYTYPDRWNALLKYIKEKQ